MVSAGDAHTCAVLGNGTVQCWGSNAFGQLGNGSTIDSNIPVQVRGLRNATNVSAGVRHTCAVLGNGSTQCWGANWRGQLGNGSTVDSLVPVVVTALADAKAVSAGDDHTCALLGSGTVQCWGSNDDGVLGNGNWQSSSTPVVVSGISDAIAISASERRSCSVMGDGTVRCWGLGASNCHGGDCFPIASATPIPVSGVTNAKALAAASRSFGDPTTCAVLNSGSVQCWGDFTSPSTTGLFAVNGVSNATALSIGGSACALLGNGSVQCWGWNYFGQLGNGNQTDSTSSSSTIVSGIGDAISVSSGRAHACAVRASGAVQCWGSHENGRLGNGTTYFKTSPVAVGGIQSAIAVSAKGESTCALLGDGSVQCWGKNNFGQLGNGSTIDSTGPVVVNAISNAKAVSAGGESTCAVLGDGSVRCWGKNNDGQLGNGSTVDSASPVTVSGITDAVAVSVGYSHACAVLRSGAVQCWGYINNNKFSGAGLPYSTTPVTVDSVSNATTISSRGSTCTLLAGGAVQCWRVPSLGDLGPVNTSPILVGGMSDARMVSDRCAVISNGTIQCWALFVANPPSLIPAEIAPTAITVAGVGDAVVMDMGAFHACAVQGSGAVLCWGLDWGANAYGALGAGHTNETSTPVAVLGISDAIAVAAGSSHTCAVLRNGTVSCWGSDSVGQLGTGRLSTSVPNPVLCANQPAPLNVFASLDDDADKVFTWAEKNFPQFNSTGAVSQSILGYRYRAYGNRYYLAVNQAGTPHLYYFDDQSMTMLMDVGLLSDFLALIGK